MVLKKKRRGGQFLAFQPRICMCTISDITAVLLTLATVPGGVPVWVFQNTIFPENADIVFLVDTPGVCMPNPGQVSTQIEVFNSFTKKINVDAQICGRVV